MEKTNKFTDFLKKAFRPRNAQPVPTGGRHGWHNIINEPFSGAWQRNLELSTEDKLTHSAVFACTTLISKDVAKLGLKLTKYNKTKGIWETVINSAHSPVLRKPNSYMTRNQFFQSWVLSVLNYGNAFIYTERDDRNVIKALHVLDPNLVTPLVSESGDQVFYEVGANNLAGFKEPVVLPASEIIHDRHNTIYHNLVGVSPVIAACLQIQNGREILNDAIIQSQNNSRPSGLLVAPGAISDENVAALRETWNNNQGGFGRGKVAVISDGLVYTPINSQNALNSQLVEQLKLSAQTICSVFHVPPFKVGLENTPNVGNVAELDLIYFKSAIQFIIESIESLLDEALGLAALGMRVEFEIDDLLRMDASQLVKTETEAVKASIKSPNEARRALNLPPVLTAAQGGLKPGESPLIQQQNYSLLDIARRSEMENPFSPTGTNPAPAPETPVNEQEPSDEEKMILLDMIKSFNPKKGK